MKWPHELAVFDEYPVAKLVLGWAVSATQVLESWDAINVVIKARTADLVCRECDELLIAQVEWLASQGRDSAIDACIECDTPFDLEVERTQRGATPKASLAALALRLDAVVGYGMPLAPFDSVVAFGVDVVYHTPVRREGGRVSHFRELAALVKSVLPVGPFDTSVTPRLFLISQGSLGESFLIAGEQVDEEPESGFARRASDGSQKWSGPIYAGERILRADSAQSPIQSIGLDELTTEAPIHLFSSHVN